MDFPITIDSIKYLNKAYSPKGMFGGECGDIVAIRPCDGALNGKTFIGIYIGEIGLGVTCFFELEKSGELGFRHRANPAIFVPDLKRVVFGCESWWGKIKDENHLRQITDEDINNTWYVKALKQLAGNTDA